MLKIDLPPDTSWKWETEYSEEGHNRPCYYCGELCDNLSGDPGKWSVGYPEKEEPGKVKYHHMECLLKRLNLLEEAKDLIFGIKSEGDNAFWGEIVGWLDDYKKLGKQ
jgi:hypothetical protein